MSLSKWKLFAGGGGGGVDPQDMPPAYFNWLAAKGLTDSLANEAQYWAYTQSSSSRKKGLRGGGSTVNPGKRSRGPDGRYIRPVPTNNKMSKIGYSKSTSKTLQASTAGAVARHVVKGKRARRVAFSNGHVVNLIRKIFMPNLNYLVTTYGQICLGYSDYQFGSGDCQPVDGVIPKYNLNPVLGQICAPANDGSQRLCVQFVHNEYQNVIDYSKIAQTMSPLASQVIPNRDSGNNIFDTALVYNGGVSTHRFHNDLNVVQHIKIYEVYARMVLPCGSTPLECWTRDLGRVALNNGAAIPTGDYPMAHASVYNYYNYPTAKTNRELHRKFHVCKPRTVTLAPGQSLSYKLQLNGFKFDEAYFAQNLAIGTNSYSSVDTQPVILPGKTKFLIIISEGERMHLPFKAPTSILGATVNNLGQTNPVGNPPNYPAPSNCMTTNYADNSTGNVHLMGEYQATPSTGPLAGLPYNPNPLDVRLPLAAAPAGGEPYSSFPGMFVPGGDANNAFILSTGTSTLDPWTGSPPTGPLGIGRSYVQLSHIQVDKFSFSAIPIFKKFNRFMTGVNLDRLGGLPQEAVRTADVTVQNGINILGSKNE